MKRLMVSAIALIAGLSSANAADPFNLSGSTKDSPATVQSWTGFYVGAGGGGNFVKHDVSVPGFAELNGLAGEGWSGMVQGGYDFQVSRLVFGVFADYEFSNASSVLTVNGGSINSNYDLKHTWTVGGRAGALFTQSTLVYGLLGYTEASFSPGGAIAPIGDHTFTGYTLGGGIETQLGGGFSLRGEYRYFVGNSDTVYANKYLSVVDAPDIQSVRAVISYKVSNPLAPLN